MRHHRVDEYLPLRQSLPLGQPHEIRPDHRARRVQFAQHRHPRRLGEQHGAARDDREPETRVGEFAKYLGARRRRRQRARRDRNMTSPSHVPLRTSARRSAPVSHPYERW